MTIFNIFIFLQMFFLGVAYILDIISAVNMAYVLIVMVCLLSSVFLGSRITLTETVPLQRQVSGRESFINTFILALTAPILLKLFTTDNLLKSIVLREFYYGSLLPGISYGFLLQLIQVAFLYTVFSGRWSKIILVLIVFLLLLSGTRTGFLYFLVVFLLVSQKAHKINYMFLIFPALFIFLTSLFRVYFFEKEFDMSSFLAYTVYPFGNLEHVLNGTLAHKPGIERLMEISSQNLSDEHLHAPFRYILNGYTNVYTMYADYYVLFGSVGACFFVFMSGLMSAFFFRSKDRFLNILGAYILCFLMFGFFNEKILLSYTFFIKLLLFYLVVVAISMLASKKLVCR